MSSLFLSPSSPSCVSRKLKKFRPKRISSVDLSSAGYSSCVSENQRSSSDLTFSTFQTQASPVTASPLHFPATQRSTLTRFKESFVEFPRSLKESFFSKNFRTADDPEGTFTPSSASSAAFGFSLEQATIIFEIVKSIGDGAVNIPGPKIAAGVVKEIVTIAQRTKNNSKSCSTIAKQSCQLINALTEGLQRNATAMEDDLVAYIDTFINDLKSICGSLTKDQKRKSYQRLLNIDKDADAVDIATRRNILSRSAKLFRAKGQAKVYLNESETDVINKTILQIRAHILICKLCFSANIDSGFSWKNLGRSCFHLPFK